MNAPDGPPPRPPRDAICAVILRPTDGAPLDVRHPTRRPTEVLVIERAAGLRFAGYWTFVTGALEAHESQPDAVAREVQEEVGLSVVGVRKIWECPTTTGEFLLHWWLAYEPSPGVPVVPAPDEVAAYRWIEPMASLLPRPTFADTARFLEEHARYLA